MHCKHYLRTRLFSVLLFHSTNCLIIFNDMPLPYQNYLIICNSLAHNFLSWIHSNTIISLFSIKMNCWIYQYTNTFAFCLLLIFNCLFCKMFKNFKIGGTLPMRLHHNSESIHCMKVLLFLLFISMVNQSIGWFLLRKVYCSIMKCSNCNFIVVCIFCLFVNEHRQNLECVRKNNAIFLS